MCVDPTHPSAAGGVAALSEAVTHARFVGTNPASDEVVLMKILQVWPLLTIRELQVYSVGWFGTGISTYRNTYIMHSKLVELVKEDGEMKNQTQCTATVPHKHVDTNWRRYLVPSLENWGGWLNMVSINLIPRPLPEDGRGPGIRFAHAQDYVGYTPISAGILCHLTKLLYIH